MTVAFQANAFQDAYPSSIVAFQTFDRAGNITLVSVYSKLEITLGPLMKYYKRTDTIVIEAYVKDPSASPPLAFNPTTVQINILNPDGTTKVSLASMSNISTGRYKYIFVSASNDQLGAYTGNIKAVSGGYTSQTITQEFFRLV